MMRRGAILLACVVVLLPAAVLAQEREPLPAENEEPSSMTADYWISAPIDGQKYDGYVQATEAVWTWNKGMLVMAEALDSFRAQLVGIFSRVLAVVIAALDPFVLALFALALALALAFVVARPFFATSFARVDNVLRVGLALLIALPLADTALGAVETFRCELARGAFTTVFDTTLPLVDVSGDQTSMAPIQPYHAGQTRVHDVVASYLFFTRADVTAATEDLPAAFQERYYDARPDAWETQSPARRAAYITQAADALERMVFGIPLAILAPLDALLHVLLTLGVALLLLALVVNGMLSYFGPWVSAVSGIINSLINIIAGSFVMSVLLAMLLAYEYKLAQAGNANWVFGIGLLLCGVEIACLWVAIKCIFRSFATLVGALAPGTPQDALGGLQRVGAAALGAAGGAVAGVKLADGVLPTGGGIGQALQSYSVARQFGATSSYAAADALSPSATLQGVVRTGLATGLMRPEDAVVRGVYHGAVTAKGEPNSLRGMLHQANAHKHRGGTP